MASALVNKYLRKAFDLMVVRIQENVQRKCNLGHFPCSLSFADFTPLTL